jgi:hypothetical protein
MKNNRGDEPVGVIIHIYMEISQGNSLRGYIYLKQAKMLFFFLFFLFLFSSTKSENRKSEQVLPRGVPVRRGRWQGKGVGG